MCSTAKGCEVDIAPRLGYASMTSLMNQIDRAGVPILVIDLAR
jgi:hypothetical protein